MNMSKAKQTSESIELGVLLAISGGMMDAYSYMARGKVFANALFLSDSCIYDWNSNGRSGSDERK